MLTRVIPAAGRSRAYIDGRPVTVNALATAATDLVDLHGQHAHQQLLSPASQRRALDGFGAVDLVPLRAARARLTEIDAELASIGGDERTRARELDLARFQLAELDAAAVDDPDEESALEMLEDTLAGAVEHRLAGSAAYEALSGECGARDALGIASSALAGRAPYRQFADRLASVIAELEDVMGEVRDAAEEIVQDPDRLESVRSRRQQLARPLPEVRRRSRRGPALSPGGRRAGRRDRGLRGSRRRARHRPATGDRCGDEGGCRRRRGSPGGRPAACRRCHGEARRPCDAACRRRRRRAR